MRLEPRFAPIAVELAALGRRAYDHGWVQATSGNFSAVLREEPLRLAITPSGRDKGALAPEEMLEIDAGGRVLTGSGRPSAETALHLAVVRGVKAKAVAHTHSIWSTLVSNAHAAARGVRIEGYEMLKGLAGIARHDHSEWLPIFENTQDWQQAAPDVERQLAEQPGHGFLIRGHGLYTWGRDVAEASRHLEALEFLLEAVGRRLDARSDRWQP